MRRQPTRHTAIVTAAIGLLLAAPAWAQPASVATQTVDNMNKVFGSFPATRANHAKGVVAEGSFTPSPAASGISKATIFAAPTTPVVVRFSDSTGIPTIPDNADGANPHGLAIKFRPTAGGEVDVVTNALKFFPVATGEEFRDLLGAIAESGPNAAKPTKVEQFFAAHPAAGPAFASATTPSSFARETYNGVNAFVFIDAAGKRQPFRFKIVPVAGDEHLTAAEAAAKSPDYLATDLATRLAAGPVAFRLTAQLADASDPINDATKPWPDDRKIVDLGTITLTKLAPDSIAASKPLLFLPNRLADGIVPSDDPLILARVQAYFVSFARRQK